MLLLCAFLFNCNLFLFQFYSNFGIQPKLILLQLAAMATFSFVYSESVLFNIYI